MKKDKELPKLIESEKGSDVFYRNLRSQFGDLDDDVYIKIILGIFAIVKNEAIVDWYKNIDVKRKMINRIDDYLYDVVRGEKGINVSGEQSKIIIDMVMQLAENNFELFL